MKKTAIKAFTLVEMLIVIVIIGILIASLMPRMQSAQGRARDVARKNDLSQIQTAIITYQQDKWKWPELTSAEEGMAISWTIVQNLKDAWMSQVPTDPNGSNVVSWLWVDSSSKPKDLDAWAYGYMVTYRNSIADAGFVLMARTEVEWSSNWLVCDSTKRTYSTYTWHWNILKTNDLKDIQLCSEFKKSTDGKCGMLNWVCTYTDSSEFRYILVY